MMIHDLITSLRKIPKSYFGLHDIEKFYPGSAKSLQVALNRLVKKGTLKRIMRGYYTFDLNDVDFEELACSVKRPSYISLESALYHHGLLEQIPESLTLITTGKSQTLICASKTLEYSHIKPDLYFGYEIVGNTLIATREKALLDELYLITLKKRRLTIDPGLFESIDKKRFREWSKLYPFRLPGDKY